MSCIRPPSNDHKGPVRRAHFQDVPVGSAARGPGPPPPRNHSRVAYRGRTLGLLQGWLTLHLWGLQRNSLGGGSTADQRNPDLRSCVDAPDPTRQGAVERPRASICGRSVHREVMLLLSSEG